jgi:hypothetical protein
VTMSLTYLGGRGRSILSVIRATLGVLVEGALKARAVMPADNIVQRRYSAFVPVLRCVLHTTANRLERVGERVRAGKYSMLGES